MWTYFTFSFTLKLALLLLTTAVAARFCQRKQNWVRKLKRKWRRFTAQPWLCAISIGILSLVLNGLLTIIHYPLPRAHDEFSYQLASDTFAHGRFTNPEHPLTEHFETYHVLSKPSYASKYPPGSAAFMAVGQKLTGHSITGVWLAYALASMSLYWMMRSWTSQQWAAIAGILFASNGLFLRAWGQTWWGGSVALMGGALLFGGFYRIWSSKEDLRLADSILLGVGMVLLAISRPAEGALVSLPVAVGLCYWYLTNRSFSRSQKTTKAALPIVAIGIIGLAGIARYNHAVTGDVWKMPYVVHDNEYSASAMMIWKTPPEIPTYTHSRMKRFYLEFGRERQLAARQFGPYWKQFSNKFVLLGNFVPIGIWLSLVPLWFVLKSPRYRFAFTVVMTVLLVHTQFCASFIYPHYLAPALALFFAINIRCLRQLKVWRRKQGIGTAICKGLILASFLQLPIVMILWSQADLSTPRSTVLAKLNSEPQQQHLVICSYGREYPIHFDWVYNDADIDASKVVWARDMGPEKNQDLRDYYSNRKTWRLHIETDDEVSLTASETR